jgi:FkbM family methyltransferase
MPTDSRQRSVAGVVLSVSTMENTENSEKNYGRKSYSQLGEDVFIEQRLRKRVGGLYLDIGAYHPFKYSNTELLRTALGWKGINIDASSQAIDAFNLNRGGDINICAAVGDKVKNGIYYEFEDNALNTTNETVGEKRRRRQKLIAANSIQLNPVPKILNDNQLECRDIELLNLDISGSEFDVLVGMDWSKMRPKIIAVSNENLKLKNVIQNRIYLFLSALGYNLVGHLLITSVFEWEA